ncbi:MAG: MerR family transcriptional regulator [Candidatus Riflebacteria bacterium]|nr:MerR family transcriptional regulator [Candidatus Riflebacteria bacterium]
MEDQKTLQEVSKDIGISTDKARYWLSLLEVPTEKKGRVIYLPIESIEKLSSMTCLVEEGFSPGEAAKRCKNTDVIVPVKITPEIKQLDMMPFFNRMEALEKAIMLLAEDNRDLKKDVSRLVEQNCKLQQETTSIRLQLTPPITQIRKVQPWQPEQVKDPLAGMSLFQRILVRFFRPEQMRRFEF